MVQKWALFFLLAPKDIGGSCKLLTYVTYIIVNSICQYDFTDVPGYLA